MSTIEELLSQLDLSKFAPKFKEEDIDLAAAKKLSDEDMKDLGLTLGARKKLLGALQSGAPAAAGSGAQPSAAAASVSPSLSPAAAAPVIADVRDYHWLNGGRNFVEGQASGLHHRVPVSIPKSDRCIGITNGELKIWDIASGQSAITIKYKPDQPFSDADAHGDLLVAVGGGQYNNDVFVYSYSTGKELATYQALKEGGLHHMALNPGASGSLQALCLPGGIPGKAVLFDIGPSSVKVASKFELTDSVSQIYGTVAAPGHTSTFLVAGGAGFIGVIDGREKRVVRKILGVEYPGGLSFPATSNGQFLARGNIRSPVKIIDFGTGKILHSIPSKTNGGSFNAAAMYANAVVTNDAKYYYFYDLQGAPAEINEAQHELRSVVEVSQIDMTDKYVVGSSVNGTLHAISL